MIADLQPFDSWQQANQRYLSAELTRVRRALELHLGVTTPAPDDDPGPVEPTTAALDEVTSAFRLSPFERDILLMCAGVELESGFGALCATAQGDGSRTGPTFSLALAALHGAHWSALTPAAPLRAWRLIEVSGGGRLTTSQLRIDERILHFLAGINHVDERLAAMVEVLDERHRPSCSSQQQLASGLAATWRRQMAGGGLPLSVQFVGDDPIGQLEVAHGACAELDLPVCRLPAEAIPLAYHELDTFLRLWQREARLTGSVLLLDCHHLDESDHPRSAAVRRITEALPVGLIVSARQRLPDSTRVPAPVEVRRPNRHEQADLWRRYLGGATTDASIDRLVSQFDLSASTIAGISETALEQANVGNGHIATRVWDLSRARSRPRLDSLAQRIDPKARWSDLVLPGAQLRVLHEVVVHVRQRGVVYDRWGFAARYARGLGISLLAAGPSGTGKTMAAEVLANELRLDLYHIDLSQVVSKYIGETEKNLRQLFDAAEGGGAILLFDEADALFGKRSEVKDSHDRYANIEISYLLQRMESYQGLAILTTNMKDVLDPAFVRRIRFVVQFPFPDTAARAEIWRRVFPPQTPTDVNVEKLARLNLSGGSIRNMALHAAFLAADAGEPVHMGHLARAARGEFAKLEKPLNEAELAAWT